MSDKVNEVAVDDTSIGSVGASDIGGTSGGGNAVSRRREGGKSGVLGGLRAEMQQLRVGLGDADEHRTPLGGESMRQFYRCDEVYRVGMYCTYCILTL